jgi:adenine deaminase
VMDRLMQGYTVSLRHSSIRPDLPKLLDEILELGIEHFDKFLFTTDGSPPSFYEQGLTDQMIRMAIDRGVPVIDAYNMATINIARHYNIEYLHGNIGTGRVANINFLDDVKNPTPVSVLAKGQWVKRDGIERSEVDAINWDEYDLHPLKLDWGIESSDLEFSMPFGIEMVNDVITKPYSISSDASYEELSFDHDECFLMMVDAKGKWRINTIIKGFANKLCGFASSYSNSGDIILIGKRKEDMILAFNLFES